MRTSAHLAALGLLTLALSQARAEPPVSTSQRSAPPLAAEIDHQLRILDKTDGLLDDNLAGRRARLRAQVRAAYKASYRQQRPPWMRRSARAAIERSRRHQAIAAVLTRSITEFAKVADESQRASAARVRIENQRERASRLSAIAPGSLHNPVAYSRIMQPFGIHRHARSGARLSHRGVLLSSRAGRNIRAVAAGKVRFVGPIRGLGQAVLIQHERAWSLLGPMAPSTAVGVEVTAGDLLGESLGDTVYLELRMDTGGAGLPIDPTALIDW